MSAAIVPSFGNNNQGNSAEIKSRGRDAVVADHHEHRDTDTKHHGAYDLACRKCGNEPGSSFTDRHKDAVEKHHMAAAAKRDKCVTDCVTSKQAEARGASYISDDFVRRR